MLFEFHLRPVDEIAPWTTPSKNDLKSLSWFGLTDGFYRLKVGDEFLLNYSDELTKDWAERYPKEMSGLVSYQVARLWEDILAYLPNVLTPLPRELLEFLSARELSLSDYSKVAQKWFGTLEKPKTDLEWYFFDQATSWLHSRASALDTGFLKYKPELWIWSQKDTVTISWNTFNKKEEGIPVWSATTGSYSMPRSHFLEEVHRFNDDLISQMERRVAEVCSHWKRPEIFIDFPALQEEQLQRAKSLQIALVKAPTLTNWDDALKAMRIILKED